MKKTITLSLSFVATIILATGCTSNIKTQHKHTPWSYEGDSSPQYWEHLDEKYSICGKGSMQTPINIIPTNNTDLLPLQLNYKTSAKNVINNGHSIQVNVLSGSNLLIDNQTYELKQFHFHTPSENNIQGNSYPLEAHFVHATQDGKLAVIAVMFEEGEENQILKKIWDKFPLKRDHHFSINLNADNIKSLLPSDKKYYKFMGSLTTPPCSENVKWIVLKDTMSISEKQVKQFFDIFGHPNNRLLQKRNDRIILE
jgi:carbonic anhydrase